MWGVLAVSIAATGCQLVYPLELPGPLNPPRGCSPSTMLTDNFDVATSPQDFGPKWSVTAIGGASVTKEGGVVRMVGPANNPALIDARHYFELRDRSFSVEVVVENLDELTTDQTTKVTFELLAESGDSLVMGIEGGATPTLIAARIEDGVFKLVGSIPHDATAHRHWKIEHDGDDLTTWHTSADGVTFERRFELPGLPWVGFMKPVMKMVSPVTLRVLWDNFNGGGEPTGEACPASTLRDDFATLSDRDGGFGLIWANRVVKSCSLAIVDGAMVATWIHGDTLDDRCVLESSAVHDLRDNAVFLELGDHTLDPSNGRAFFGIRTFGGRTAEFARFGDQLAAIDDMGGSFQMLPYDAANHRFLKLSATGDDVLLWEVAEDGGAFQPFARTPAGHLGALDGVTIRFGIESEVTQEAFATFDRVNLR